MSKSTVDNCLTPSADQPKRNTSKVSNIMNKLIMYWLFSYWLCPLLPLWQWHQLIHWVQSVGDRLLMQSLTELFSVINKSLVRLWDPISHMIYERVQWVWKILFLTHHVIFIHRHTNCSYFSFSHPVPRQGKDPGSEGGRRSPSDVKILSLHVIPVSNFAFNCFCNLSYETSKFVES